MIAVLRMTIGLGMVLCVVLHGRAEGEEEFNVPYEDEGAFRYPYEEDETETFPSHEEEEFQHSPSDEAVFEEDLPDEGAASEAVPAPAGIPPFMSRPLEWESTPPTVIGIPPLPSASTFSDRELVAFKFTQKGKESFDHEEWEFAQEQFERAISVAPSLPYSYYFLGRIAFGRGDLKRALAFLQKAELLLPRADHAWLAETTSIKGTVYEELNDYPQARVAYRRSLRFQPANLKVLSALARLPEEEPALSDAIPQ